jgi:hypothetical protein
LVPGKVEPFLRDHSERVKILIVILESGHMRASGGYFFWGGNFVLQLHLKDLFASKMIKPNYLNIPSVCNDRLQMGRREVPRGSVIGKG